MSAWLGQTRDEPGFNRIAPGKRSTRPNALPVRGSATDEQGGVVDDASPCGDQLRRDRRPEATGAVVVGAPPTDLDSAAVTPHASEGESSFSAIHTASCPKQLQLARCCSTDRGVRKICKSRRRHASYPAAGTMRVYAVICSCGYRASQRTLGQAASDLTRHLDENPGPEHAATVRESGVADPPPEELSGTV